MKKKSFRPGIKWSIKIMHSLIFVSLVAMFTSSVPLLAEASVYVFVITFISNAMLVSWGMFFPNSQLFGYVLSRGDTERPVLALTFDDGPHPRSTPQILDILARYHVPATFFVIGQNAFGQPQLIERMKNEGHEIENHTWEHPFSQAVFPLHHKRRIRQDLEKCNAIINELTGWTPAFVRFPAGIKSIALMEVASELKLTVTGFSVRAFDSPGRISPDQLLERITSRVFPGAIILLHDRIMGQTNDALPPAVQALPDLIVTLQAAGYSFVTVSQLAAHTTRSTVECQKSQ